ncbi:hypothetical protein J6I39_09360 [bacterium]|nr:hypothetical protein [bacterium]
MSKKVLIISEDKHNSDFFFSSVTTLKRENTVVVSLKDIKSFIDANTLIIFFNADEYTTSEMLSAIEYVNKVSDCKIIVMTAKNNREFVEKCSYCGVLDILNPAIETEIFDIRIMNYFKIISLETKLNILSAFINITNVQNFKTGFYTHKAFVEAFNNLIEFDSVKNGIYIALTINPEFKTKVSMNRLALNMKKILRQTDILIHSTDKYYLLLPDTNIQGAENVVEKISASMGNDIKIHAGLTKVGITIFNELEKRANDSLISAITDDKLFAFLGEGSIYDEWNDIQRKDKHFKLFEKVYDKKLSNVIEPLFFRYEKELAQKLPNSFVSQYTNKIESVFSIRCESLHSELIIRYDGFAKLTFEIKHNGLDTCENMKEVIALNSVNEKLLSKYLKKLYNEFRKNANS